MKLKLSIAGFEVSYSGSEEFAEQKLHGVLKELAELAVSQGRVQPQAANGRVAGNSIDQLSDFLRRFEDGGKERPQTDKFLATSTWLHLTGMARIKTGNVIEALKDHNETALANPSHCLAMNINRKLCERDDRDGTFFVTATGFNHLGLDMVRSADGSWTLRDSGD